MIFTNYKKLIYVVFFELCIFWALYFGGIGIETLINKYFPEQDQTSNVIVLNIQIVLITLLSVIGRPLIMQQIGGKPDVNGTGILYAYALLLGQKTFKERASKII